MSSRLTNRKLQSKLIPRTETPETKFGYDAWALDKGKHIRSSGFMHENRSERLLSPFEELLKPLVPHTEDHNHDVHSSCTHIRVEAAYPPLDSRIEGCKSHDDDRFRAIARWCNKKSTAELYFISGVMDTHSLQRLLLLACQSQQDLYGWTEEAAAS